MSSPSVPPERAEAPTLADAWVVWSPTHKLWWCADRGGYSPMLMGAGLYTEEEAKSIERFCSDRGDNALPLRVALNDEVTLFRKNSVLRSLLSTLRAAQRDSQRLDWLGEVSAPYMNRERVDYWDGWVVVDPEENESISRHGDDIRAAIDAASTREGASHE